MARGTSRAFSAASREPDRSFCLAKRRAEVRALGEAVRAWSAPTAHAQSWGLRRAVLSR